MGITSLANPALLFCLVVSIFILLFYVGKSKKLAKWLVTTSLIGTIIVGPLAKLIFLRSRPLDHIRLVEVSGPSFPSGHALGVSLVYGCIFYIFNSWMKKKRAPKLFIILINILFALMAVLVAFSRVYLGVHYFTDVLAGLSLGFFILYMAISYYENKMKVK